VLTANAAELKFEKISRSLIQEEQRRNEKKPEANQGSEILLLETNLTKFYYSKLL
jgi:hypothetical protein